ncbi:helicase associated domain-containing protein [Agrococcus pavilionensis]|uniref:helicase associated domain-containing protein n=1 Tax=Agrococcus pavilionensis TaxID=1346502 RepID=UPI001181A585
MDSYDAQWVRNIEAAREFYERTGRMPRLAGGQDTDPHERRLGRWLHNARTASRNPAAAMRWSAERESQLDALLPRWRDYGTEQASRRRWTARLAELATFLATEGRVPHETHDSIGRWLRAQRHAELSRVQSEAIESVLAGWATPPPGRWAARLDRVAQWSAQRGRLPRASAADRQERLDGLWLSQQRSRWRKQALSPMQVGALDESLPGWEHPDGRQRASTRA